MTSYLYPSLRFKWNNIEIKIIHKLYNETYLLYLATSTMQRHKQCILNTALFLTVLTVLAITYTSVMSAILLYRRQEVTNSTLPVIDGQELPNNLPTSYTETVTLNALFISPVFDNLTLYRATSNEVISLQLLFKTKDLGFSSFLSSPTPLPTPSSSPSGLLRKALFSAHLSNTSSSLALTI